MESVVIHQFSVHCLWQTPHGKSHGSRWLSAYPCLAHGLAPPCVSSGLPGDFWRSVSSCNLHRRSRDPDCLLSLLSLRKGFYCEDHWEGSWGSCWVVVVLTGGRFADGIAPGECCPLQWDATRSTKPFGNHDMWWTCQEFKVINPIHTWPTWVLPWEIIPVCQSPLGIIFTPGVKVWGGWPWNK